MRTYPVQHCTSADREHAASCRQYAHVFHRRGVICIARAFHRLPETNRLALLLHECGHLLAGPRGGEDAANNAITRHTGIPVYYRDGPNGRELEWIPPKDVPRARRALGL
jgi:hypothetical protein